MQQQFLVTNPDAYPATPPPSDLASRLAGQVTHHIHRRPGIATEPSKAGLIFTTYGLVDPNPIAGERILSRNFGRGLGQANVNFRVSKTIGSGRKGHFHQEPPIVLSGGQRAGLATGAQGATCGLFWGDRVQQVQPDPEHVIP